MKRGEACGGRPERGGEWAARTVNRPPATVSTAPVRPLLGSANAETTPQGTQRPTERSNPAQHSKGRTGDCPGPRKETATRRNVAQGGCQVCSPTTVQTCVVWGCSVGGDQRHHGSVSAPPPPPAPGHAGRSFVAGHGRVLPQQLLRMLLASSRLALRSAGTRPRRSGSRDLHRGPGGGGGQRPTKGLCTQHRPPISGPFDKFHFFGPEKNFLMWGSGGGAQAAIPPPPPPAAPK